MGTFGTLVITGGILLYAGWVIRRKLQRMKEGQYCSCGCDTCGKKCACKKQ